MQCLTSSLAKSFEQNNEEINVKIPKSVSGYNQEMRGTLQIGSQGYVFSLGSKPVVWLKFLTLGTYLGLKGLALKCAETVAGCFCSPSRQSDHLLKLSSISWKAVLGWENRSQVDYAEQFSLAEIGKSHNSRAEILDQPRSERFLQGNYYARCMQPLFHKTQIISLKDKINALEYEKISLLRDKNVFLRNKEKATYNLNIHSEKQNFSKPSGILGPFSDGIQRMLDSVYSTMNYFFDSSKENASPHYPTSEIAEEKIEEFETNLASIEERLKVVDQEVFILKKQDDTAARCTKYAVQAILNQNHCKNRSHDPSPTVRDLRRGTQNNVIYVKNRSDYSCPSFRDSCMETQADVKCGEETCYKQEKICGCVYKVDFCATRCWAIDCLCCLCCIWPDARTCCVI